MRIVLSIAAGLLLAIACSGGQSSPEVSDQEAQPVSDAGSDSCIHLTFSRDEAGNLTGHYSAVCSTGR